MDKVNIQWNQKRKTNKDQQEKLTNETSSTKFHVKSEPTYGNEKKKSLMFEYNHST